jgi:hypothetical protein
LSYLLLLANADEVTFPSSLLLRLQLGPKFEARYKGLSRFGSTMRECVGAVAGRVFVGISMEVGEAREAGEAGEDGTRSSAAISRHIPQIFREVSEVGEVPTHTPSR